MCISQDCGCIRIENHPVAANAKAVAVAALESLHVTLASDGIAVKASFHLLASVSRKGIEILCGAQRENL
jgi:hypothetical protein